VKQADGAVRLSPPSRSRTLHRPVVIGVTPGGGQRWVTIGRRLLSAVDGGGDPVLQSLSDPRAAHPASIPSEQQFVTVLPTQPPEPADAGIIRRNNVSFPKGRIPTLHKSSSGLAARPEMVCTCLSRTPRSDTNSRRGQPLRCSGGSPEGVPPGARSHTASPVARPRLRKAPPWTEPPLQQMPLEPVGSLRPLENANLKPARLTRDSRTALSLACIFSMQIPPKQHFHLVGYRALQYCREENEHQVSCVWSAP